MSLSTTFNYLCSVFFIYFCYRDTSGISLLQVLCKTVLGIWRRGGPVPAYRGTVLFPHEYWRKEGLVQLCTEYAGCSLYLRGHLILHWWQNNSDIERTDDSFYKESKVVRSAFPFSSVQFSRSVVSTSVTPWTAAHQASLSFTITRTLLKLMSIQLVMPSNHLIFYCPFLLPSIFPSIRVFSNELALCIRWPKY